MKKSNQPFLYTRGNFNIIADALSRIPTETNTHSHTVVQQLLANVPSRDLQLLASDQELVQQFPVDQDNYISYNMNLPHDSILTNTPNLAKCLLEHPTSDTDSNLPFQFSTIHEYQQNDQAIANLATTQHDKYTTKNLGGHNIITLCQATQQIVIPNNMLQCLVCWYNLASAHNLGATRLHATLKQHFFHPSLASEVCHQTEQCNVCQHMKQGSQQYGELAPWDANITPWQTIAVDCISPWVIELHGGKEIKLLAMTTINISTNLLKIGHLTTKTSIKCANSLENGWLSQYPRPLNVILINGPEFIIHTFRQLLCCARIKSKPMTSHNPQGNSLIILIHKLIGSILCTLIHIHNPQTKSEATTLAKQALATAMHASHCTVNHSLNSLSPGAINFQQDMFFGHTICQ